MCQITQTGNVIVGKVEVDKLQQVVQSLQVQMFNQFQTRIDIGFLTLISLMQF